MDESWLTICIPSYNRHLNAISTAIDLLNQIEDQCIRVVVIDNASQTDYLAEFNKNQSLASAMLDGTLELIRNKVNVGMSANFLKAFEVAKTDWLWIVSDDDEIDTNAVSKIRFSIHRFGKDFGAIRFSSDRSKPDSDFEAIECLDELVRFNSRTVHDFNGSIFISNWIYRIESFSNLIEVGYQHAHTYIPHFIMLVEYLNRGERVLISNSRVVRYVVPKIGYSYGLLAGLGVGGTKSLLLRLDKKTTKQFYSLFFPHNDYKVIIDLYCHCRYKSTASCYVYHANNYLHLVSMARSPAAMAKLRTFYLISRSGVIFNFMLNQIQRSSRKYGKHITEIVSRYSQ